MVKLNIGAADLHKEGYINIDRLQETKPDLLADGLNLSAHFKPESVDEIWASHLLEHLYPDEAEKAVAHWRSLLKPSGTLGVVTPDFRYICEQYLSGAVDLKEVNNLYLYSYVQPSHHRWMWDIESLMELFSRHGFKDIKPIDKMADERLAYFVEWQVGVDGKA